LGTNWHYITNSLQLKFARLFDKLPRPGDSEVTLRSSSRTATCYYLSNHSKAEAIPLSALPKDTTRELSGLTSHQWCSKTTKLQDQDRSGQDQDHFFKIKTAFFKDHQIIKPRPQKRSLIKKIRPVMPATQKYLLITGFLVKFCLI